MFEQKEDYDSEIRTHGIRFCKRQGTVEMLLHCSVSEDANGKSWRPNAYEKTKKAAREKLESKLEAKAKELANQAEQPNEAVEDKKNVSNTLVEQLKTYAKLKRTR